MNNKFSQTRRRLEVREIELYIKIMNKILGIVVFSLFLNINVNAEIIGELITNNADKVQKGNIGLVDTYNKRIIEIDNKGKVIWEKKIPRKFKKAEWNAAADIEWLPETDTFLIIAPKKGFFEINRKGKVLNSCKNKHISHDLDKLDDGSFIFVNGWDLKGEKNPIVTKVTNDCKIVMSKSEDFFDMDKADLNPKHAMAKDNMHSNSIRILEDESIMLSVRNYDQVVVFKNNKIIKRFKNATGVHDPSEVYNENGNNFFYYIDRKRPLNINKRNFDNVDDSPKIIWPIPEPHERKSPWIPLRTLEKLENGNWLVTGSQRIGQVTNDGELVWELNLPEFRHQKDRNKDKTYIYKVTFISK